MVLIVATGFFHSLMNLTPVQLSFPEIKAPLASSEAVGHLQGGSTDSQGADHSYSGVSQ